MVISVCPVFRLMWLDGVDRLLSPSCHPPTGGSASHQKGIQHEVDLSREFPIRQLADGMTGLVVVSCSVLYGV